MTGGNAHGLDAAEAGALNITNVTASSTGTSGSIIATDRGGGTVTISGGTGAINTADTGLTVGLTLDSTSSWQVGGTSYLTTLSDTSGISGTAISNIYGNGYTVYYVSASNSSLGGKTYTLAGTAGGYLKQM